MPSLLFGNFRPPPLPLISPAGAPRRKDHAVTDFIDNLLDNLDDRYAELAAYLDDLPGRDYTAEELDAMTRYQREQMTCPDCAARTKGNRLEHKPGCPIGDGYDTIQTDDRTFFERFPDVMVRRRKPVLAELLDVALNSGLRLPPNPYGKAWTTAGTCSSTAPRSTASG